MEDLEIFEWAERPMVPKEQPQEEAPVCDLGDDDCTSCGA